MNFAELIDKIQQIEPAADPAEVARICMFLLSRVESSQLPTDLDSLQELWAETKLQLQGAMDQHAAMTEEIHNLACSDPRRYSPDQVWTLVRAIKVQSQLLHLYTAGHVTELA